MAELLVLGGTGFVGGAVVAAALAAGHSVTSLSRGGRGDPPAGSGAVHADRNEPEALAAALRGRTFDAVIDVNGMTARQVRVSTDLLRDRVAHYALVSTVSLYAADVFAAPGPIAEDAATQSGDPDDPRPADMAHYGEQKRGAELALLRALPPERTLIARPSYILGPGENVHRIAYWLSRCADGGPVIGPGGADRPLQFVDVRDLADWLVRGSVMGATGICHTVNPPGRDTWGDWVTACLEATGSGGTVTWLDDDFLLSQGVMPNFGLPMWVPGGLPAFADGRAVAAGFRARSLRATVAAAWEWWQGLPRDRRGAGQGYRPPPMTPADEARVRAASS